MIRVTKPCVLKRFIESTIYNDKFSKYGSSAVKHNTILHNLGYRGEPKVFIEIQRNEYNPSHVNKCAEVKHGKDSIDCQSIGETNN